MANRKHALYAPLLALNAFFALGAALSLTAAVACPLMRYGKSLHRFYGWLSGIKV